MSSSDRHLRHDRRGGEAGDAVRSTSNPRIVAARKLRARKERLAAGAFLVEGPHAVAEALASDRHQVRELFVTPGAADEQVELLRQAARLGVRLTVVADPVAASLADTQHPQGVFAVVALPKVTPADAFAGRPSLVALLVTVADPGNLGTVIRSADAAGADAVVLTDGCADPYAGKVVRASAGSVFHLPVVTDVGFEATVAAARGAGLQILATALDGEDLDEVDDVTLARPTAWVFGNEAHGLPDQVVAAADRTIRIPIHGRAESLNLAAAAAVCLYASARARRRSIR